MALNIKRKYVDEDGRPIDNPDGDTDQAVATPLYPENHRQIFQANQIVRQDSPTDHQLPADIPHSAVGVFELWKHMMYTASETEFDKTWERLKTDFNDQEAIIRYLDQHYMPWKGEWAACFINKNRNFGQRTTSPTEASHRDLKSYLINGNSSLFRLSEVMQLMINYKEKTFKETIETHKTKQRQEYVGQRWLGSTSREVSYKAIDMMAKQRRLALNAIRTAPGGTQSFPQCLQRLCTGTFRAQYGLPCSHELQIKLEANEPVLKTDCDSF